MINTRPSEGGKDSGAEGHSYEGYSIISGILKMGAKATTRNGGRFGRFKDETKENKGSGDGA